MFSPILIGGKVPEVWLGELHQGSVRRAFLPSLVQSGKAIMVGVPGAFTPVCSREHVPDFVLQAHRLRASGFETILCVVANDPFAVDAWAKQVDPEGKIRFVSDGNLDLATELGVKMRDTELFLGTRAQRYLMLTLDGIIQRFTVEKSILAVTCTRARDSYVAL